MKTAKIIFRLTIVSFAVVGVLPGPNHALAADHNDPNPINSIFSDIPIDGADLYDFFGFPSDDKSNGEKVVAALTFAPRPGTGIFDPDLLYRLRFDPDPRIERPTIEDHSLNTILEYAIAIKKNFLEIGGSEVRVTVDQNRATLSFLHFPAGDFTRVVDTNSVQTVNSPDGHKIKVYVGGRDDAFFNDLPGFFRSINYGPQFYNIPLAADPDKREFAIPKTLLELEGNDLFNFNPDFPTHGRPDKIDLPIDASTSFTPTAYKKDANGNFRFVYTGRDAQAGFNVNAIVLEMPLAFVTKSPLTDRVVNAWGESWVLKAAHKIESIPDYRMQALLPWLVPTVLIALGVVELIRGKKRKIIRGKKRKIGAALLVLGIGSALVVRFLYAGPEADLDEQLKKYKLVDTDGVPFSDAALSERAHSRQLGANNIKLALHFVKRTAHLGWGFGPSLGALGIKSSFDYGDATLPVHKKYKLATTAFPRVKKVLFQELNMPDGWNPKGLDIPLKRGFEIFIPNVCAIDMDTTGTWPFGRRLEDQVATRFLSIFLDMKQTIGGKKCHVDTLSDQSLWDSAPIEPKTPPNPLKNDTEFLDEFPYLAEPW